MPSVRPDPSVKERRAAPTVDAADAGSATAPAVGATGLAVRIYWMIIGPGILALVFVAIVSGPRWSLSRADGWYWLLVGVLLAARTADARWLQGRTADGGVVTPLHLRRYWLTLVGASIAAWICAQAIDA